MKNRRRHQPSGRAQVLLDNALARAKKKQIPFSLDLDWIIDRLVNGRCEATGIRFDYEPGCPYAPSIDRKNSNGGYTPENCQIVIVQYNLAKGRWSHETLVELAEALFTGGFNNG